MSTKVKLTPMLQQYMEIKKNHEDAILFYRMGDFYEMFFEDAVEASKILNITLTARNKKNDSLQVPMCGIPYHASKTYLAKLIQAGRRVAICEQTEDPATAKGIVKREVVQVVSPGIITDNEILDDKSNNYICCIITKEKNNKNHFGTSFLDVSTGEFLIGEITEENNHFHNIIDQLTQFLPSEILYSSDDRATSQSFLTELLTFLPGICTTQRELSTHFDSMREVLYDHFNVLNLDGFGCSDYSTGILAAASLLEYVKESQRSSIEHIEKLTPIENELFLHIDDASRRNLELVQTLSGGQHQGSLLSVIDHTCTPMGARLLKHNLLFPLQDKRRIDARLDATTFFFKNSAIRTELRNHLEAVYDLERLNSRIILGSANGRDLLALKTSFEYLLPIYNCLQHCNTEKLLSIREEFDSLDDLNDLLDKAIHPQAPITVREGNIIKEGYNAELDELIHLLRDGKQLILNLESKERENTGIAKLKIGFNKVFGYFIEVGKTHTDKIPDHYIRKQTLVNAERFITPELKEFENKVLNGEEKRVELEYRLFSEIRNLLAKNSSRILKTAHLLAQLDFLSTNGEIAHRFNYRRPEITNNENINIIEGRHPVIERSLPTGQFVPNDVFLDQESNEVLIITGPNMAGKSTVLRQTALLVLMAQMGCYVSAEKAEIGIVDRIFTRVGAMDNLRRGQSTFMVEMSETANILNNATEKSLVILDEIGRGTSTYDGLSIAWAVAEELVLKNGKGVKTLFATHYHELTELAKNHKKVQNFSISVREWQDKIIFLHKLIKGGTSRSYGIQVASLAGVPEKVVNRAHEILKQIDNNTFKSSSSTLRSKRKRLKKNPDQLSLFPAPNDPVRDMLDTLDVNSCTPLEALNVLSTLKQLAEKKNRRS